MPAMLSEEIDHLAAAAALCGASAAEARVTLRHLLSEDGILPREQGRSVLNANGSPMEVCVTASAHALRVRGIGDPAFQFLHPGLRYEQSLRVLDALPALRRNAELAALCTRVIDLNIAHDCVADYTDGVMWLAAGIGSDGMAVYLDAYPPGPAVAWTRARQWLHAMLGDPAEMLAAIDALSQYAQLCSIGLEAASLADARAKIHVRLQRSAPLASLGIPLLCDEGIGAFLQRAAGERELPFDGVVLGAGASVVTGAMRDAKIDLAGSYLHLSPQSWVELTDWCADTFSLQRIPMDALLANGRVSVAYIGLGVDAKGNHRLNVYLKAVRA